ncbi:hypothetical protein CP061683_0096B, partial [Chlamydia psittaci 06-1683]
PTFKSWKHRIFTQHNKRCKQVCRNYG